MDPFLVEVSRRASSMSSCHGGSCLPIPVPERPCSGLDSISSISTSPSRLQQKLFRDLASISPLRLYFCTLYIQHCAAWTLPEVTQGRRRTTATLCSFSGLNSLGPGSETAMGNAPRVFVGPLSRVSLRRAYLSACLPRGFESYSRCQTSGIAHARLNR